MRKEDIYSFIVYGLMIGLALFVGLEIISPAFQTLGIVGSSQYGYALITIAFGFILNAFLLELGHLLGAFVGGYTIKSMTVLGLSIYKVNQQWKFGFKSFEGLTGETVVAPKNANSQPVLNLWGGLILYLIEVIVAFFIAYSVFSSEQWGRYASIIVIAIGGMLMIYNFMPFKMETVTDGYRLATLPQGKGNEAFNELTRIEKAYANQQSPRPFKTFKELNSLSVQVLIHEIYDQLANQEYDGAKQNILRIKTAPKLGEALLVKAFSIECFYEMMTRNKTQASEWFYQLNSKEKKFLSNNSHMMTISAYLIVAGTIEDSFSEAAFCYDRKASALKKTQDKHLRQLEEAFFEQALKRVLVNHPDWVF